MNRYRLLSLLFLLLPLCAATAVQTEEESEPSPGPITATIAGDTRLHKTAGSPLAPAALRAGTEVKVLGTSNGWMRVAADNKKGWVDRRFLKTSDAGVDFSPKAFSRIKHEDHAPCKTSIADCPKIGCATGTTPEQEEHALFNTVKHGPGSGSVKALTLADFARLQKKAGALVGEGAELSAADRGSIHDLDIGHTTTGEGHMVSVTGFIVADPHPNTGESVNCNLTAPQDNDLHISLASASTKSAFESIVVEPIPQTRDAGWTIKKIKALEKAKQRVMVTGQLFYDNAHRVRKSDAPGLSHEPKRFSLWEVHPISEFLVCTNPPCSPTVKSQWKKLEDLPEPD